MEMTTMSQALQLHAQILKSGLSDPNTKTQQNLSKLFTFLTLSPNGNLPYARTILNSLSTPNSYYYNTLIRAYSQTSDPTHHGQSLSLFLSMLHHPTPLTPKPDKFTFPFVLRSCARLNSLELGKQLHGLVVKMGFGLDRYVAHGLIHMYSVCGVSSHAFRLFEKMYERDVVSWTCMIDGFVEDDCTMEALRLFERMVGDGVEINVATVVSVLRACADNGALGMGKRVHKIAREKKLDDKANVNTGLIDMYTKCGSLDDARKVFDEVVVKDVFIWTAMISGLASHGRCEEAIAAFDEMRKMKVRPDEKTITAVLSACRNAGWVSEALWYFENMGKEYGVRPTIVHYGCMVDLLARAGRLDEAEEFIRKMPVEPDSVMWRTLIWACKVHGDTDRGERIVKHLELIKTDPDDCGSFVLVGNVYASAGKWREKAKVRQLMNLKGIRKPPGCSKIEANGSIHEFTAGDSSHAEAETIYQKLDEIEEKLAEEGYRPKLSEVLLEIDDEEKANQLQHHSEKLAVAFGLIKTDPGSEIRIVKNLRSCEDCHTVMKLISKMYQREIIIRDRIRFHYFKDGECSCRDHW